MKIRKKQNLPVVLTCVAILVVLTVCLLYLLTLRGIIERQVDIETCTFTESAKELNNPNRGYYYIYGFLITDRQEDYPPIVAERYGDDSGTALTQIQINLQEYREGDITEAGLANIEALFSALKRIDKQLIVRFVYDWNGENLKYEPQQLDIILRHMKQLKPILTRHSKQIFTLQGLFIGNWGEMNGSKYQSAEELRRLADTLAGATDDETYLSVRMPAQWRTVTSAPDWQEETLTEREAVRIGLFNDGILGNESDYGTYGTKSPDEPDAYTSSWDRADELIFQEELCRRVPNGGEVIHNNPFNDLDNAIRDFAAMHITYLNQDYDRAVFNKWAGETITEEGCFSGMDGLTYMERHLGYRLLITAAAVTHRPSDSYLSADITLKNVGFAPLYRDAKVELNFYSEKEEHLLIYEVPQNLRKLSGGARAEELLTIHKKIPLSELTEKTYDVYVTVTDTRTGRPIFLANEQEPGKYGYKLAAVKISLL